MSLSDEEFQRFQNQLVDLKTRNYQLEEQNKKISTENAQLKTHIETVDKESINLRLPTKLPWKIRRVPGRDPEEVQRENDLLTRKVHSQEEEFKLQNETIMHELNEYRIKIEQLEDELKLYKDDRHANANHFHESTDTINGLQEDNRRLKAENNVFQKKLAELSAKSVESISTASSSNESFQRDDADVECEDNRSETGLVHVLPTKSSHNETKPFDTNSMRLETEQEEKRLLQEQIRQLETSSNETNSKLTRQIEMLKEKLDEKQNTCLQLQHDFEKRIQDIITDNNHLKATNELQIDALKSDVNRLQDETQTITKVKDDHITKCQVRLNELQMTIDQLESQIGTVSAEQNHQLRTNNAEHQRALDDKDQLLHQTIVDRDQCRVETEQSKEAYETLMQTVQTLEEQVTSKTRECESQQRLAEERKMLIDQMTENSLKAEEKANSALQSLKAKYQAEIERLEKESAEAKIKERTLKQLQSRHSELETSLTSNEELRKTLTSRLEESQQTSIEREQEFERQCNEQQHAYDEETRNYTASLKAHAHTIEELNAQLDALKQEATTFVDEKRTHERKGAALMKDLQKQLTAEKKRNERMQEKLTELLSGDKAALDDLFYIPRTDGSRQGDTGSVSSFGGTGYMDRASVNSTPMSSVALEQENKELIQKLARTQEERSILEEKVRHLESSSSAMANDLIQHYSHEKRGSVSSANAHASTPPSRRRQHPSADRQLGPSLNLRNMFDNLSGSKSQSNNDDTIKNLQRLLEETLTKNMHLQKDLEAISLQLHKPASTT